MVRDKYDRQKMRQPIDGKSYNVWLEERLFHVINRMKNGCDREELGKELEDVVDILLPEIMWRG